MTTPISTAARGKARIDGIHVPQLISFDPGLDCTAWATFARGLRAHTALIAVARLRDHGSIETDAKTALGWRLKTIYDFALQRMIGLRDENPLEVAIEVPSKAGQYRRTGAKNAAAMQNVERVIGVLTVAAVNAVGPENVRLTPAPSGKWAKKEHRHAWLRSIAREAGVELPLGPRGGVPLDVWDAIWNGVQVIRTPRINEEG